MLDRTSRVMRNSVGHQRENRKHSDPESVWLSNELAYSLQRKSVCSAMMAFCMVVRYDQKSVLDQFWIQRRWNVALKFSNRFWWVVSCGITQNLEDFHQLCLNRSDLVQYLCSVESGYPDPDPGDGIASSNLGQYRARMEIECYSWNAHLENYSYYWAFRWKSFFTATKEYRKCKQKFRVDL